MATPVNVNYMQMKDPELKELMKKYDMNEKDFIQDNGNLNRQMLCNMLKMLDVQLGKVRETIIQHEEGDLETYTPTKKIKGKTYLSGMMVEIEFYNVDENDLPYVQLGLQGTALTIPRERKTWIPKEFVDGCLKHTVVKKLKMVISQRGDISYAPKAVPRFQYIVHNMMHIEELRKAAIKGKGKI
jgi:hypothetical protein